MIKCMVLKYSIKSKYWHYNCSSQTITHVCKKKHRLLLAWNNIWLKLANIANAKWFYWTIE